MACSREENSQGGASRTRPPPPPLAHQQGGPHGPRLPWQGLPLLPEPPPWCPFFPALSRKSAKQGGGPSNKSSAAMETRPSARGQIPASHAQLTPRPLPGRGGRFDFEKIGLQTGSPAIHFCIRMLMLCGKHHFSLLGASMDTEKGSVIRRKGLRSGAAPGPHLGLPRLWVLSFPWD